MERAFAMPDAHSSILKPGGTLSLSIKSSLTGLATSGEGLGTRAGFIPSAVLPCAHVGGTPAGAGAGAGACALANVAIANPAVSSKVGIVLIFIVALPCFSISFINYQTNVIIFFVFHSIRIKVLQCTIFST
jgi:hypothetical protein